MSEERIPDIVYLIRLPQKQGKKVTKNSTKLELFHVSQFRRTWGESMRKQSTRKLFSPMVPIRKSDFDEYWQLPLYRVRMDGRWTADDAKYSFYTREQIVEQWFCFDQLEATS